MNRHVHPIQGMLDVQVGQPWMDVVQERLRLRMPECGRDAVNQFVRHIGRYQPKSTYRQGRTELGTGIGAGGDRGTPEKWMVVQEPVDRTAIDPHKLRVQG